MTLPVSKMNLDVRKKYPQYKRSRICITHILFWIFNALESHSSQELISGFSINRLVSTTYPYKPSCESPLSDSLLILPLALSPLRILISLYSDEGHTWDELPTRRPLSLRPLGVLSLGVLSLGVLSLGVFSLGVLSLGVFSLGVLVSWAG